MTADLPPAPTQPPYRVARLPARQLSFDRDNPRLPPRVDADNLDEVLRFMLDDASLVDLARSIAAQGYFPGEPLLVCPTPEMAEVVEPPEPADDGQYIVVEGNRRLAAVLLLSEPERAPVRRRAFEQMKVAGLADEPLATIIFPTRNSILDYLGYRHITGIKEWDPIAKAQYLDQLRRRWREEGRDASNTALARVIGSQGPYVGRLLAGLGSFKRLADGGFFERAGLDQERLPFSLFTTALNYEHIPRYMGIEPDDPELEGLAEDRLEQVATWLYAPIREREPGKRGPVTALEESRNMRYLDVAVQSHRALDALSNGATVKEAARLSFDAPQVFSAALTEAKRQVRLAHGQADAIERPTDEDDEALHDIHDRASEMVARFHSDGNGAA